MKIKYYEWHQEAYIPTPANVIAAFKNELISEIWKVLPIHKEIESFIREDNPSIAPFKYRDSEKYFEINRKISDIVDKRMKVIGCEFKVDSELYRHASKESIGNEAKHKLAHQLARGLLDNDELEISVTSVSPIHMKCSYVLNFPFIVMSEKD